MVASLPSQEPKPALREALLRHLRGEEKGRARITVRIVKCSTVLSDRGNLYGGYKALLDQLRNSGLIPDDDTKTINEEVTQIRVAHLKERGTHIRLIFED